jgi:SAM-dependent methyltransferase
VNELRDLSLHKVLAGIKVLAHGRPKCQMLVRSIVRDKRGVEIGGPSNVFRRRINLPIYNIVLSLDNCDYSQNTTWSSYVKDFYFDKHKPPGKTYILEACNLSEIPDNQYDFLLPSHNLEHLANPIKGLKEWQRVVKPGGHLVIVLPHYARSFDYRRVPRESLHKFCILCLID